MIRHVVTETDLHAAITAMEPDWFTDAQTVLGDIAALSRTPKSEDFPPLWSKIKRVYIKLQHSKCGFCEKDLEGDTERPPKGKRTKSKYKPLKGDIEQDVEHFRPKAAVRAWAVPADLAADGVPTQQAAGGYNQLTYEPLNYVMSCKTCNTQLKGNYFPIEGTRDSAGTNPRQMAGEQALLIYPNGDVDTNPEHLIAFDGVTPKAIGTSAFERRRGKVTIHFFRLDGRTYLDKMRSLFIRMLYVEMEGANHHVDPTKQQKHQTAVNVLTSASVPFANCLRSFQALYKTNRPRAEEIADACLAALDKNSKAKFIG